MSNEVYKKYRIKTFTRDNKGRLIITGCQYVSEPPILITRPSIRRKYKKIVNELKDMKYEYNIILQKLRNAFGRNITSMLNKVN